MFLSRNKKNNVYTYKLQFYYIEMGFKGVKLYRHVFVMNCGTSQSRPCEAGLGILTSWDIFLSLIAQFNLHLSSVWFSISFILHKYVFLMQKKKKKKKADNDQRCLLQDFTVFFGHILEHQL